VSRESPPTRRVAELLDTVVRRPGHSFTLAELAKDTGISKATCLGIVNELTETGWLSRDPGTKTYRPGATMLAAGAAAEEGFAAIHLARPHMAALTREIGMACTASAVVDDLVTVLARTDPPGRPDSPIASLGRRSAQPVGPAFRVGQRYPFAPPSGVMFVAWEDDRTVEAWLAGEPLAPLQTEPEQMRAVVESCRARGHLTVGLGEPDAGLYALLSDVADAQLAARLGELLQQRMPAGVQPYLIGNLNGRKRYDVSTICAPVFDRSGHLAFLLAVLPMRSGISGTDVRHAAAALMRACDDVTAAISGHNPWASDSRGTARNV
jgi:DNA-binding IclR family transcriptional regulator